MSASGLEGNEKRLLIFRQEEHFHIFLERIRKTSFQRAGDLLPVPKTVVDCELPGPWSKYATVWRVMYKLLTERYLEADDFFFF
ncbi:hypothetical protein WDW86_16775 [Bdellovibrionota bacterium FG-2]